MSAHAPMRPRTAYMNARILDPAAGLDITGSLLVESGIIQDMGTNIFEAGISPDIHQVDCVGLCLAPGILDMYAELPGSAGSRAEPLASSCQAAVAGGITTFVTAPDGTPVVDTPNVAEAVQRRGHEIGLANVLTHGALTMGAKGEALTEIGLLYNAGCVGFSNGTQPVQNTALLRQALVYAQIVDTTIISTPLEASLIAGGQIHESALATRLGLRGIPVLAETLAILRDIALAEATGARIHIGAVSTAAGVNLIRAAKAKGIDVTAHTAPPYFSASVSAADGYRTFAKLLPPLREEGDVTAILAGLSDGTIDAIASHHSPHAEDQKRVPFAQASFGAAGFETMLPLALDAVAAGRLPMLRALEAMTSKPAEILRLRVGRLVRRQAADFILFDPKAGWVIDSQHFVGACRNTPFQGRNVKGQLVMTIKNGRTVHTLNAL
ncbi:MAG: dihydroorotase [Alphaproteobacteria bacterium]|nr:dihydroorotase [Alphaproteobacteria bacterium]